LGIAVRCDHKLDADTEEAFARVERDQGRLDLLVNNAASYTTPAGPPEEGTFWEQSLDVFDQLNLVGLRSTFVASICAARMMVPNRAGLIVNVSSAGAAQPGDNVPYNVVKAGVDMMTQGMAKQLQGHGVAVLSIWPRLTRTEGVLSSPVYASHLARAWHPEFNGRAVAALAADPAVLSKTGRAIDVLDLSREYGFTDVDGRRPDA
jgi:dehydrogenase/reductase SDR family protein 1